jgi:hypothetical protein
VRLSDTVITRGSDIYKTHAAFDTDRTSATYSYGFPTRVQQWSNLGGGARQTDTVYAHNKTLWILGLPSTVTKNGSLFDAFMYDTLGRVHSARSLRRHLENVWVSHRRKVPGGT